MQMFQSQNIEVGMGDKSYKGWVEYNKSET